VLPGDERPPRLDGGSRWAPGKHPDKSCHSEPPSPCLLLSLSCLSPSRFARLLLCETPQNAFCHGSQVPMIFVEIRKPRDPSSFLFFDNSLLQCNCHCNSTEVRGARGSALLNLLKVRPCCPSPLFFLVLGIKPRASSTLSMCCAPEHTPAPLALTPSCPCLFVLLSCCDSAQKPPEMLAPCPDSPDSRL
jgi:hypothetical protein